MEHARVLVVDDDRRLLGAVERTLLRTGFDVTTVSEGHRALMVAEASRPDVAIVDRCIGRTDGLDVIRGLKSLYGYSVQTMILSSADEHEMRMEALEAGADDFVAKPVELNELARKVTTASRLNQAMLGAQQARKKAETLHLYSLEASALLAHDLNNGLTVALCNLRELAADQEICPTERDEMLTTALHAVQRMAVLTANFVDLGRFEDGVVSPRPRSVDLTKLVRDTAHFYGQGIRESDFRIELECAKSLVADVDPVLVERVLHNLLGNATRYVHAQGCIEISLELQGDMVVLQVANDGPEIPQSAQKCIFEKNLVAGDGRSVRGLGLYFCRLACEAHGGTISVKSRDSKTAFRVELPRGTPGRRRPSRNPAFHR
jgi:signal transduction histidine kinase